MQSSITFATMYGNHFCDEERHILSIYTEQELHSIWPWGVSQCSCVSARSELVSPNNCAQFNFLIDVSVTGELGLIDVQILVRVMKAAKEARLMDINVLDDHAESRGIAIKTEAPLILSSTYKKVFLRSDYCWIPQLWCFRTNAIHKGPHHRNENRKQVKVLVSITSWKKCNKQQ